MADTSAFKQMILVEASTSSPRIRLRLVQTFQQPESMVRIGSLLAPSLPPSRQLQTELYSWRYCLCHAACSWQAPRSYLKDLYK